MDLFSCCAVKSTIDPIDPLPSTPLEVSKAYKLERNNVRYSERNDPPIGYSTDTRPLTVNLRERVTHSREASKKALSVKINDPKSSRYMPLPRVGAGSTLNGSVTGSALSGSEGLYDPGIVWLKRKGNLICIGFVDGSNAGTCGVWIGDILKSVDGFKVMHMAKSHQDKNLKEAWDMKERQEADRVMEEAQKRMRGGFTTTCTLELLRLQPSAPPDGPAPAPGQGIPPMQALHLPSSASSSAPSAVPVDIAGHPHTLRQLKCVVQRMCANAGGRKFGVDKSYLV